MAITSEYISVEEGDDDAWVYVCGNTPDGSGFETCLKNGDVVEPNEDRPWDGHLYKCMGCGRIIDQDTRQVVGRAPSLLDA